MSISARMSLVLIVALLCMVPSGLGQPAPAPELDCTDSLTSLLPCLDYVTNAANNVSRECCSGLTDVNKISPLCLCSFLGSNSTADLGINVTRALELPALCNVTANPADCVGTPPVAAPPTAPISEPVPSTTPATPPTTAPTTVPTVAPTVSPATPAPTVAPTPPSEECDSKIAELAPCLSFVTGQTGPPPSADCCSGFSGVVATAPTCLCSLLESNGSSVSGLNTTLALQLPTYCNVQVNLAECSGGSTPTPPVAGAPVPSAEFPTNYGTATVISPLLTIILIAAVALQILH